MPVRVLTTPCQGYEHRTLSPRLFSYLARRFETTDLRKADLEQDDSAELKLARGEDIRIVARPRFNFMACRESPNGLNTTGERPWFKLRSS
jgi:hypothetical protein